jgi:hypothetical protein
MATVALRFKTALPAPASAKISPAKAALVT